VKHQHKMPFGAEILDDAAVRFRLWAPRAQSLAVELPSKTLPMSALDDGWFECITREAGPGTRYQFTVDRRDKVPDPASRYQPSGVHGPSEVIHPEAFEWRQNNWHGRPWEETILYELHLGSFSPEGTFAGAERKLDYLAELGITAIELMPLSSFPGQRNWGYDGVLPYAPAAVYGWPDELKHLIDCAHSKNMMVFLDVVYNHFGPEGNYLHLYAPQFFTERHHTPWGQAINFDAPGSRTVRDYFIHNTLYWLEEYRIDGLRFDAVHAIFDDSNPDILSELAETVRKTLSHERHVHLVLENDNNAAHYLSSEPRKPSRLYNAQWNDDIHHAAHVLLTGESDGYYADYSPNPARHFGRCLAQGFSYQGESSVYRDGKPRGEPSRHLPLDGFVSFLQNHDQVGNRAFGERITSLADANKIKAVLAVLLLAPLPPLLFMGEEFGASTPFLFFCDFEPALAVKAREGRRSEFARFAEFSSPEAQARIPDPNREETFFRSKLDWACLQSAPHRGWLSFYRQLLALRRKEIAPRIKDVEPGKSKFEVIGSDAVRARWLLASGRALALIANFSTERLDIPEAPEGALLYTTADALGSRQGSLDIPPLTTAWFLK
jgi:maltooligosyltrehalose trehalohydrolase